MPIFSFSGRRPDNLGVREGQLRTCPTTPNCVSTQSHPTDSEHYLEPIPFSTSPAEAIAKLKSIIEGMERTQVITVSDDYLYAEFTSRTMGFVDDFEFYANPATGKLQARAAARLGKSDLGANRRRMELILAEFQKA